MTCKYCSGQLYRAPWGIVYCPKCDMEMYALITGFCQEFPVAGSAWCADECPYFNHCHVRSSTKLREEAYEWGFC